MKILVNPQDKVLFHSITFTLFLLITRIIISHSFVFIFYGWNIFLGVIPYFLSKKIVNIHTVNFKSIILFLTWLLFFPNAPYIVTDIFHFHERAGIPKWFDLLLVINAAWVGLLAGFLSLSNIEHFLVKHFPKKKVGFVISIVLLISAYGVYIGRFLRYNSWDILTNPFLIFRDTLIRLLFPWEHIKTWGFTCLFGLMLIIIYNAVKVIGHRK